MAQRWLRKTFRIEDEQQWDGRQIFLGVASGVPKLSHLFLLVSEWLIFIEGTDVQRIGKCGKKHTAISRLSHSDFLKTGRRWRRDSLLLMKDH